MAEAIPASAVYNLGFHLKNKTFHSRLGLSCLNLTPIPLIWANRILQKKSLPIESNLLGSKEFFLRYFTLTNSIRSVTNRNKPHQMRSPRSKWGILSLVPIICCSFIGSALGITLCITHSNNATLQIVYLISGFILGSYSILQMVLEIFEFSKYTVGIFAIFWLFDFTSGLVWMVDLTFKQSSPTFKNLQYTAIMFAFFTINQFFCGFWLAMNLFLANLPHIPSRNVSDSSTSTAVSGLAADSATIIKYNMEHDLEKSLLETIIISKKASEKTLVETGKNKSLVADQSHRFKHISEETQNLNTYADIINECIQKDDQGLPDVYKNFIDTNWMAGGSNYSLSYQDSKADIAKNGYSLKGLSNSRSLPNFGSGRLEKSLNKQQSNLTITIPPNEVQNISIDRNLASSLPRVRESFGSDNLKRLEKLVSQQVSKNLEYGYDSNPQSSVSFTTPVKEFSEEEDSTDIDDLPEISEESVDQLQFKEFNQTIYTIRSPYQQINQLTMFKSPEEDNINEIDAIPISSSNKSVWDQPEKDAKGRSYISLKNWKNNSEKWLEKRQRIGSSGSQMGITGVLSTDESRALEENRFDEGLDFTSPRNKIATDLAPTLTLNYSYSAPSLHTFREPSNTAGSELSQSEVFSEGELDFKTPSPPPVMMKQLLVMTTPVTSTPQAPASPIKKLFQESPKRLSSVFRKNSVVSSKRPSVDFTSVITPTLGDSVYTHRHNASVASNTHSVFSNSSSRSGSPKRSLKLFKSRHRRNQSSIQSISLPPVITSVSPTPKLYEFKDLTFKYAEPMPLEVWDLSTTNSSDRSRVSSVPSAVIGEYDREKWRTLKILADQRQVSQANT